MSQSFLLSSVKLHPLTETRGGDGSSEQLEPAMLLLCSLARSRAPSWEPDDLLSLSLSSLPLLPLAPDNCWTQLSFPPPSAPDTMQEIKPTFPLSLNAYMKVGTEGQTQKSF